MKERLDELLEGMVGWRRVTILWSEIGKATREASKADSTDELLSALDWITFLREAHSQEIATCKEQDCMPVLS